MKVIWKNKRREYILTKLEQFKLKKEIVVRELESRTLEQNRKSKVYKRYIIELARFTTIEARTNKSFWPWSIR